eukprot:Em0001g3523a
MLPFLVGIYTGDEDNNDQRLCVVEHKAIRCLCQGLVQQHCCRPRPTWQLESFMKFINFCKFAEIGVVSNKYIHSGLNVTEVAHDYQSTVKTYVEQLGMVNSYDKWHGMKNVAKEMKKICAGPVKARDKTWFAQLSDKARSTKVHLYWCMKNCASNPDILCNMIMNISQHFQGHHLNCHLESRCRQPGYHSKRKILTMREAIKAYEDALKRTLIYRFAGSFCRVCSFMQNENTQRASTSHGEYLDVRRPDHHITYNVLKRKTFQFVRNIWNAYILKNISSLHSFEEDDAIDELMSPDDSTLLDGEYVDSESEEYQEDDDNDA